LRDDGLRIRRGVHADVVTLEGADERLGHAVGLRATDRGLAPNQPDVASKSPRVARGVATTIFRQPFDWLGQAILKVRSSARRSR
jgi:hypothetical protein